MATIAEQLRAGEARIRDEANWNKGSWAKAPDLFPRDDEELLSIHQVCAVMALVQASVETGDLKLDYLHEVDHNCDDIGEPYCVLDEEDGTCITGDVVEEAYPLDNLLEGLSWSALEYLELAASDLYDLGPMDVNDAKQYTHADVVAMYERAILLAEADGV